MLGKLIKHEWLGTWKIPTALCLYIGILTVLGCVSFLSPMWEQEHWFIGIIAGLSIILYIFSLFALVITVFVYFVVRFYRNMYSNEGYLMHTLPVKSWQLIFSKGLIFFIWLLISGLVLTFSVLLLMLTAASKIDGVALSTIWMNFKSAIPELSGMWKEIFGFGFVGYWVIMGLSALISMIYFILMIYTSISIGQLFHKFKVLASFIAYACINFVVQLVSSLLQMPLMIMSMEDNLTEFGSVFSTTIWLALGLSFVLSVVYALVTNFIMRKKLNLD